MASYLCVKMNSSATKSYNIKSSANKPYLRVDTGFIPLTTATATGPKVMVRAGGVNYRLADFITTTTAITTGTSYLTSQKTTSTSYVTDSRASTSGTGYETRSSASSTGYETRSSTSTTGYLTRSSTSTTGYLTRSSTSTTGYKTRASTYSTTYSWRSSTYGTQYLTSSGSKSNTNTLSTFTVSVGQIGNGINIENIKTALNASWTENIGISTYRGLGGYDWFTFSNSNVKVSFYNGNNSSEIPMTQTNGNKIFFGFQTNTFYISVNNSRFYSSLFRSGQIELRLVINLQEVGTKLSVSSSRSQTYRGEIYSESSATYTLVSNLYLMHRLKAVSYGYYSSSATKSFIFVPTWCVTNAAASTAAKKYTSSINYKWHNFTTKTSATSYQTRQSTSTTGYLTKSSTSSTTYGTRSSTSSTTYGTRSSTSSTTYGTRSSTSNTTYATRSSTSATTYATRSSQYTSDTSYLTQSETYETSYLTTSAETTMEG